MTKKNGDGHNSAQREVLLPNNFYKLIDDLGQVFLQIREG